MILGSIESPTATVRQSNAVEHATEDERFRRASNCSGQRTTATAVAPPTHRLVELLSRAGEEGRRQLRQLLSFAGTRQTQLSWSRGDLSELSHDDGPTDSSHHSRSCSPETHPASLTATDSSHSPRSTDQSTESIREEPNEAARVAASAPELPSDDGADPL